MRQHLASVLAAVTVFYLCLNVVFMTKLGSDQNSGDTAAPVQWQQTVEHARSRPVEPGEALHLRPEERAAQTTAWVSSRMADARNIAGPSTQADNRSPSPRLAPQAQQQQQMPQPLQPVQPHALQQPQMVPPSVSSKLTPQTMPPPTPSLPKPLLTQTPSHGGDLMPPTKRRSKPMILYRTRFMEPSGFSQEAIDFVRGLSKRFYVGIQMEGNRIDGYVKSWSPELHEMINRYHNREQYILGRPHTLIHHGAAGDFFCDDKPERPMYCIGRAMFETDRVPFMWVDNLQTQHQLWVPSAFNVHTFARSGLDPAKIRVVPEPLNTTLFDPAHTTPLRLSTGKHYHILAVYAWNDRKGWDRLLKAYWAEFTVADDVCLVLRTFPKHRNDANFDPEASGEWVHMKLTGAASEWFGKDLSQLAKVHVIATHLSERDLPRLYKAADAFALPSRGEGWGRPIVEAMAMGMPTVVTDWGAPTDFANISNAWPAAVEGLSCVNSEPRRGNPAGVYAGHRWAEASIPSLREILRKLYENKDPEIAARAAAARCTMQAYGYTEINAIVEAQLVDVPAKYTHDPHERLRELYEDFFHRPPTDQEIQWADASYPGWQNDEDDTVWKALLCDRCTSREFLGKWDEATMPSCTDCGSPLEEILAPFISDAQICAKDGVDVVYTYASDSDASYREERTQNYQKLWVTDKIAIDTADAVATQRARAPLVSWLFRMSLRSLEKNAPWIRTVHVVTDTPPHWLNNSNVHVVRTADIMPAEHLPTFNSHAVEANLHKVPGLAECYLYFNSDYFLGRQIILDDFIDQRKGQYKLYLEMDRKSAPSSQIARPPASHDAAFRNANVLLDRWGGSGGSSADRNFLPHAPHFLRRSVVEELSRKAAAEFEATSSHRFRSFEDLHVSYLHGYYMLENPERFMVRTVETSEGDPDRSQPTYTIYLFNRKGQPASFYAQLDTLRKAATAGDNMPPFFSINDAMDDSGSEVITEFVRDTLLSIYPTKSRFELNIDDLGSIPNTDSSAMCPPSDTVFASELRPAFCPEMWQPESICTRDQTHEPCDYVLDTRPLRCLCCYPARLTWQCEFNDSGPALNEEADNLVNPAEYIVKTNWRGRSDHGVDSERPLLWSGVLQTDREKFELEWGRCHTDSARNVLVALPYDDIVPCPIRERMFDALLKMECANPGFNLHLALLDQWEPDQSDDRSRREAVARLRNRLIMAHLKPQHDLVLWLDGGVVNYPADLVYRLHRANPGGITAPLILLEDSAAADFHQRYCGSVNCAGSVMSSRPKKFHDPRSFIISGKPLYGADQPFPGNVGDWPPYLGGEGTGVVDCETVGTTYLLPADVYRTDRVPPYFATPFSENFPVIHAAKYELNLRVVVDLDTSVEHALTLRYGTPAENFNRPFDDSGSQWRSWLAPYLGKLLSEPGLRHTARP